MTSVFQYFNLTVKPLQHDFLLPPGISFYTFQAMSYIIDVYRGRLEPERHLGKFALWVAFFPQLIAGPIERASQLLPQFHFRYNADYDRVRAGATRFLWGLFKKLVVADNLALLVSPVFAEPASYHGLVVWVAAVLFLYQLFYDFSAYADMAVGLGLVLGIHLSENFTHRLAWMSSSFAELWRNWHITLTIWIRDYIYVPLAKVIRPPWLRRFLPLLTFTLMGIWHGAGWTFVIWGALNGLYFTMESWLRELRLNNRIARLGGTWTRAFTNSISSVLVFTLSTFAIVFFRAENYSDALTLLQNGFQPVVVRGFGYLPWFDATVALTALALAEAIRLTLKNRSLAEAIGRQHIAWRMLIYVGIIESILLFAVPGSQKFIYFQF